MIEMLIDPRDAVLTGEMHVRRILPFRARRMVGPFTFLDEMGPITFAPAQGTLAASGTAGDVPPHPHIGLATVTYLFEGAFIHRDSLGTVQEIRPRELNWMSAGKGVVHSERIPSQLREQGTRLHGLQAWVALPLEFEESEPSFQHFGKESLPTFEINECSLRLIAGQAYGHSCPVKVQSRLFYLEVQMPEGKAIRFDPEGQEAGFYLLQGEVSIGGRPIQAPVLVVFKKDVQVEITAARDSMGMLLGGDALEGHRTIWWNFVSSSKERIEVAKELWRMQGFPPVPGETEFVPLPGSPAAVEKSTLP